MRRLLRAAALAVFALAAVVSTAVAHEGNPNYRSEISGLEPPVPGVSVEVLNFDDRLLLTNESDRTITVEGYDGEAYARVLGDGTVQVNRRSPATYLNEDRFAQVELPAEADSEAPPQWETLDRTGRLEWHDHRSHWMGEGLQPQVEDGAERTKIFDYEIPLRVDGRPAELTGTLTWVGQPSGFPIAPFIGLGGLAVASVVLVAFVRRRRRRGAAAAASGESAAEAW